MPTTSIRVDRCSSLSKRTGSRSRGVDRLSLGLTQCHSASATRTLRTIWTPASFVIRYAHDDLMGQIKNLRRPCCDDIGLSAYVPQKVL